MEQNIKPIIEKLCEEVEFKINSKTVVSETKPIYLKTNLIDCISLKVIIDKDNVVFES
ncbi:hypothetical protein HN385_06205 [archaeon]|jgi:hypothetical protein|nr:hypothetical protein [archaeon]